MLREAKKPASEREVPTKRAALFVLGTIADTTWRIFLPVLGGIAAGAWLDRAYGSAPFAMLSGTVLGALMSGGLVYLQIKQGLK